MKSAPLSSIFRNRRGAICSVCFSLVFFVVAVVTMWIVDVSRHGWHDLPAAFVPGVVALGGVGFLKYRDDRIAQAQAPAPAA